MPTTPTLNLTDDDYRWVTYRPLAPRPLPKPRPTTAEALDKRLRSLKYYLLSWQTDWTSAKIAPALELSEALFWFWAMTEPFDNTGYGQALIEQALDAIHQRSLTVPLTLAEIKTQLTACWRPLGPELVLPLRNLLPFPELVQALLAIPITPPPTPTQGSIHHYPATRIHNLAEGFRRYALPYATEADLEAVRPIVRAALRDMEANPETPPLACFLAARLGLHPEVEHLVQRWPHADFVFGLPSLEAVTAAVQKIHGPIYARAWLAHAGLAGLEKLRQSIENGGERLREEPEDELVRVLCLANAPAAAPHVLALHVKNIAVRRTREWLDTHPTETIAGLLPIVVAAGELAQPAATFLRKFYRQADYRPHIEAAIAALAEEQATTVRQALSGGPDARPAFDATTTPDWLTRHQPPPAALAKARKAGWADPTLLPPLIVDDHQLNDDQVLGVLAALQTYNPRTGRGPLLAELKARVKPAVLDAFVWQLYERWIADGADSKEKWALTALGALGGDAVAQKLAALVRVWPGQSQTPRARLGIACLRAIGSDMALMQISGIANKVKFKALQAEARHAMGEIAQERQLSRAQLEDRIVPDCGLDEKGRRMFDFGPRQFQVVLTPEMKAVVRDSTGKTKDNLPKPNSKDDAEKAAAALAEWKLIKKQIQDTAKIQSARLEQSMVTGRRWPVAEFELFLVRHPLMINLARLLLWGSYVDDTLTATFRLTEDQTYADAEDNPLTLDPQAQVGVVHPLALEAALKAQWGQVWGDYELVPPFPQLGRDTHTLEPDELETQTITRFAHLKVPAPTLVGTLEKQGWVRGPASDGGVFYQHAKYFPAANITAIVQYSGVPMQMVNDWEDQTLEACAFYQGHQRASDYLLHKEGLLLGQVNPLVVSEVLRDLLMIAGKAK